MASNTSPIFSSPFFIHSSFSLVQMFRAWWSSPSPDLVLARVDNSQLPPQTQPPPPPPVELFQIGLGTLTVFFGKAVPFPLTLIYGEQQRMHTCRMETSKLTCDTLEKLVEGTD